MRKILSLVLLFCGILYMQAQDKEPLFEKEGKMVKATYYHDNGAIAQMGHLLDGKLHGEWTMFDSAGKRIATGHYMGGVRTGKWFFWNDDLMKEVDFVDNKIVSVVQWVEGEPVAIN